MIADIAIAVFVLTAVLAGIRLLIGPGLGDRVIALDVMLVSLMGVMATRAAQTDDTRSLGIVAVIAIVGFTATVAMSRFIERTGRT